MAKLTVKQKIFCEEYVANFGNATKAALKAGYSPQTARGTGCDNLTKPNIQEYIKELSEQVNNVRIMKVEEALAISTAIARGEGVPFEYKEFDPDTGEVIEQSKKIVSAGIKERNQALEHIYKVNMAFDKPEKEGEAQTVINIIELKEDDDV